MRKDNVKIDLPVDWQTAAAAILDDTQVDGTSHELLGIRRLYAGERLQLKST